MKSLPVICLTLISPLPAQDEAASESSPFPPKENHSITFETFSLPLADAADLIRSGIQDPELYETCVARLSSSEIRQESLTVIRCRSSERVASESILETIYPTEYEPPEIPNSVTIAPATPPAAPAPSDSIDKERLKDWVTPATPTAFETRNLGITVEVAPITHAETDFITLNIAPEWVRLVGRSSHGQGFSKCEMPEIEKQSISTAVDLLPAKPFLLGTFNRSPESTEGPTATTRVWFAFVTITPTQP